MTTDQPQVSILINAFNEERYIKAAIDSALAQSWENFEVVIFDDCSTDHTAEIVKGYSDARIRYIKPEKRLGIIEGRNELLRAAAGRYITYLDADDLYLPDKIKEEAGFLDVHPEFAAVYCGIGYFFDGAPEKLYRHRYEFYSGKDIFPNLLEKMFITNTAAMFRREVYDALGGYRTDLGLVEDWEYFLRMSYAGYQIAFLDKDLVRYRLRWDSHTNFKRQALIQESAVKIFEDLRGRMTKEERERHRMDHYVVRRKERYAIALAGNGEGRAARALLRSIASHVGFARRSAIIFLSYLPTPVAHVSLDRAWQIKKKGLFKPV
jgi:glycosyltransferase involved in cell wall biosynthesis